jgi:hypothetical protein
LQHPAANVVDQLVLFDSVLRPVGIELAIGTKYELVRRPSAWTFVIPSSSNLKWRVGSSKGELIMGFSMTTWLMLKPS